MERLTKRNENGNTRCGAFRCVEIKCSAACEYYWKMIEKLAEYEDLEEQGLLCRLALKPNDTVYVIFDNKIYEAETVKVVTVNYESGGFTRVEVVFEMEDIFYCDGRMMKHGANEVLGEKVFLTMEEAELKLKKSLSK